MCHFKAPVPLLKTLLFASVKGNLKKKKKTCGKHRVMAQVWKAQVWKPKFQLNFNPCLRALQSSEHLCASVSPATPLPLGLAWSFSLGWHHHRPARIWPNPLGAPQGPAQAQIWGHTEPQAPPAVGGDPLSSHPSSRNVPKCFSPSPGLSCEGV